MFWKKCEHDWESRTLYYIDNVVFNTKDEYIAYIGRLKSTPSYSYPITEYICKKCLKRKTIKHV